MAAVLLSARVSVEDIEDSAQIYYWARRRSAAWAEACCFDRFVLCLDGGGSTTGMDTA